MNRQLRLLLPDHRDQVESRLDWLSDCYPSVAERIGCVRAVVDYTAPVARAYRGTGLVRSRTSASDLGRIEFNVVRMNSYVSPRWSVRGADYVTCHEFGHHFQFYLEARYGAYDYLPILWEKVGDRSVSNYAERRPSELIAELFAQYHSGYPEDFVIHAMESLLGLL